MKLIQKCSSLSPVVIQTVFLTLLGLFSTVQCIPNVLVIDSGPSISHAIWMKTLTFALAEYGYNVTVLSWKPSPNPPKNLHYLEMKEYMEAMTADAEYNFLDLPNQSALGRLWEFIPYYSLMDEVAMSSDAVQVLLNYPKDFQFDLFLVDYLGAYALISLREHFNNPPFIAVSPYPNAQATNVMTGAPELFPILPNIFINDVEDSFCARLENTLFTLLWHFIEEYYIYPGTAKIARKYVPSFTSVQKHFADTKLQMPNYHPIMDKVHPIMPSVIPVGALQITEPKPLPEEIEEIYRIKSKGVILFSLGSNIKSEQLGKERLDEIIEGLRGVPDYTFLWKIDVKGLDLNLPKNVFIKDWLPQNDMLADNRTVLFISHAGGLSTQESTWFGVPMLCFPVMFDQFTNAQKAVDSGMALQLNLLDVKSESFKRSLLELLNNKVYTEKAKLRSRIFRDQPEKPIERALWWIDYVIRNPEISFLKSSKLESMSIFVKQSCDVIAFLVIVGLTILIVFAKFGCFLLRKRSQNKTKLKRQ